MINIDQYNLSLKSFDEEFNKIIGDNFKLNEKEKALSLIERAGNISEIGKILIEKIEHYNLLKTLTDYYLTLSPGNLINSKESSIYLKNDSIVIKASEIYNFIFFARKSLNNELKQVFITINPENISNEDELVKAIDWELDLNSFPSLNTFEINIHQDIKKRALNKFIQKQMNTLFNTKTLSSVYIGEKFEISLTKNAMLMVSL